MKRILALSLIVLFTSIGIAQTPIGNPPPNINNTNQTSQSAWYRGGNNPIGFAGVNNIFGTIWNSPIYTHTADQFRMIVNGDKTTTATSTSGPINTNGFVGINTQDPYSRLHLSFLDNAGLLPTASGGWRNFMREGLLLHKGNDMFWFGLTKQPGFDNYNSEIIWSDDAAGAGPDDMVFRFSPSGSATGPTLQVMRYTNSNNHNTRLGNIGIGPLWNNGLLRPASLLHLHRQDFLETWYQVGNESGTGNTDNDGLKLGVRRSSYPGGVLSTNGYLRWQENTPFIVQTDWNNTPGFGPRDGERLRITSVGSLLADGNYLGLNTPANTTRVAISHQGNNPILRPMSLLHLGADVGTSTTVGVVDGWRSWMDVGTLIVDDTDNMYIGLKTEGPDRQDAVVNWGDNQIPGLIGPDGPDNLRFIFTSTDTGFGTGDSASQAIDGLEIARMEPGIATSLDTLPIRNSGMMGIGDFSPNSRNAILGDVVDAKLDIDGDLRIRRLWQVDSLNMVLVADSNDLNRVHWRAASTLGGFGSICGDTVTRKFLPNHSEIFMNDFNFHFSDDASSTGYNNVGIGTNCDSLIAKLQVVNRAMPFGNATSTNSTFANNFGFYGQARGGSFKSVGTFGRAVVAGPIFNYGVEGRARNGQQLSVAGNFEATGSTVGGSTSIGVQATSRNNNGDNYGLIANAQSASGNTYGVYAVASSPLSGTSYGVYGEGTTAAGWFNGDVFINGVLVIPSDQMLKNNITDLTNATDILNQLEPKTFDFDTVGFPQLNLPTDMQYGLIAQEVEAILPTLVSMTTSPEKRDTSGVVITPSLDFKTLEYEAFVPILIQGFKEQSEALEGQQTVLDSKDSVINDLSARLAQLEDCINNLGLCDGGSAMGQNNEPAEFGNTQAIDVELSDAKSIVLEQNVPNPFAEQTTISFEIPEEVKRAQILFYNATGKLINSVDVDERGHGKINVFANDLTSGIYTYTLVADGQIVATKRMVKQR